MFNRVVFWFLLVIPSFLLKAEKNTNHSGFGLRFKPIIYHSIFSEQSQASKVNNTTFGITPNFAYSFGGIVRQPLYKKMLFQLGISFVNHNFDQTIFNSTNNLGHDFNSTITTFEIPLQLGYEIRLGKNVKMSGFAGISLDAFLREVEINYQNFRLYVSKNTLINTALLFDIGWSYSISSIGSFYLGFSIHNSLNSPIKNFLVYEYSSAKTDETSFSLNGNYMVLDFIYFLP